MRSPTKDASRLHELDALRFVAAVAVVLYHLTYSNTVQAAFPEVDGVTRFGYMGVDLFFIISGFVILWSAQGRSPVAFVIARFSRLYPVFWVALLTTSAVVWHDGVITIRQILLNATMVPGNLGAGFIDGAYWTLQVELNFYFLIFVLLVFGQINNAEKWAYGWLVVIALTLVTHKIPASLTVYPYGSYFAGGMILISQSGRVVLRGRAGSPWAAVTRALDAAPVRHSSQRVRQSYDSRPMGAGLGHCHFISRVARRSYQTHQGRRSEMVYRPRREHLSSLPAPSPHRE